MKRIIFALVSAVLMFGMSSCQKEEFSVNDPFVNPGDNTAQRVKSVADLIGTEWEYTVDLSAGIDSADMAALYECMDSAEVAAMFSMTFGLNFDTTYAHLTFPEDVIGLNVVEGDDDFTVEEISQMDYTYTYDPTTHTGTLTGGNLDDLVIPFTYDATNDQITISLTVDEEDGTIGTWNLVFGRVE